MALSVSTLAALFGSANRSNFATTAEPQPKPRLPRCASSSKPSPPAPARRKKRRNEPGPFPFEKLGWLTGFEPATTRSTIWGSNHAELQPPSAAPLTLANPRRKRQARDRPERGFGRIWSAARVGQTIRVNPCYPCRVPFVFIGVHSWLKPAV